MTVEDAGPYKVFEARYKAPPHPMHVGAISDRPPHNRFDVKTVTLGQNRKTSTTKHKTRANGAGLLYIRLFLGNVVIVDGSVHKCFIMICYLHRSPFTLRTSVVYICQANTVRECTYFYTCHII